MTMKISKPELKQISGTIRKIDVLNSETMNWNTYRGDSQYLSQSFDVIYYLMQIDDLEFEACFTTLVVTDNECVDAIICPSLNEQYGRILALKTQQHILHLDPRLHPRAELFSFKEFLNHYFLWIFLILIGVNLVLFGLSIQGSSLWDSLLFSCLILVIFYFINPTKLKRDRYMKQLFQQVQQMPMLKDIPIQQLANARYFYRMKEYVIDLSKVKNGVQ